jgi:hypothetical protein
MRTEILGLAKGGSSLGNDYELAWRSMTWSSSIYASGGACVGGVHSPTF